MRISLLLTAVSALVLLVGPTSASDDLNASGTLPIMVQRSTWVFEVRSAIEMEFPKAQVAPKAMFYEVNVGKVLHHNPELLNKLNKLSDDIEWVPQAAANPGNKIAIVFPGSLTRIKEKDWQGAMLFVSIPVPAKQWGLSNTGPVFLVAGNEEGVIPRSFPMRIKAASELLELVYGKAPVNQQIAWAGRYFKDKDPYLQRSGLAQAGNFAKENGSAFEILASYVDWEKSVPWNQVIAIQTIQALARPGTMDLLRRVAENKSVAATAREAAIEAVFGFPEGAAVLRTWSESKDPFLGPRSRQFLQRLQFEKDVLDEKAEKAVFTIQKKIAEKDVPVSDKLAALRELKQFPTLSAVKTLELVIRDDSQAFVVRSNALLNLAQLPGKESRALVSNLARTLTDPELRNLATALKNP